MEKFKKVVVWTLIGIAFVLFYISLRYEEKGMEYTLAALGVWGITFLINKYFKV